MTIDIPQDKLGAGVDEVGRGPLVGDVVTAAVILDPANPVEGLADSKKLSEKKRLALYGEMDATRMQRRLQRALVLAELAGRLSVLQDIDAQTEAP